MDKVYFYKNSQGNWVLGVERDFVKSGQFIITPHTNGGFSVKEQAKSSALYRLTDYSGFLMEDGTPYPSREALLLVINDFFVDATRLLEARVAVLENIALDVLYIESWTLESAIQAPTEVGVYALTYTGADELVVSKVFVSNESLQWEELVDYLPDRNARNRVFINRATNRQFSWSGTTMVALTVPLFFASQEDAETGTENSKVMTALRVNQAITYGIPNKSFAGLNTTSKTVQGAINETFDGIFNRAPRVIALGAGNNIDVAAGESFTKTCGTNQAFTISNPIVGKQFDLTMTGGTLAVPTFTGYTSTWILNALVTDYVATSSNILVCKITGVNTIKLFWTE